MFNSYVVFRSFSYEGVVYFGKSVVLRSRLKSRLLW